jgi:hypothetical protein
MAFVQMMFFASLSSQKEHYYGAGNMYPYHALNSKKLQQLINLHHTHVVRYYIYPLCHLFFSRLH